MTASALKRHVERAGHTPHFFDRATMRHWGDSMRNYGVRSAIILALDGETVHVWELYRRRPVKHGLQDSAYFRKDTFERFHLARFSR